MTLAQCPITHTRLLMALLTVARTTQRLARSDDQRAIDDAQQDRTTDEDALLLAALKRTLLGDMAVRVSGESTQPCAPQTNPAHASR